MGLQNIIIMSLDSFLQIFRNLTILRNKLTMGQNKANIHRQMFTVEYF